MGSEGEPRVIPEFVDTVTAGTLRQLFDERYVASRLTLVVAANASSLSTLGDEIESFAFIGIVWLEEILTFLVTLWKPDMTKVMT